MADWNPTRRTTLKTGAATVAGLSGLAGCTGTADNFTGGGENTTTSLCIATDSDPSSPLHIYVSSGSSFDWLKDLVYDRLLAPSPYVEDPMPGLATETTQQDATTWTATIRTAANSTPAFWVGMLFVSVFAFHLGWFPSYGISSVGGTDGLFATVADRAMHLVLPLATLTLARTGGIFLVARGSVLTTTSADFVRFERAKGLSERAILFRHALPNSLLPIYTRFTLQLGTLVGGAVVVETVFSYPGLGLLV